MFSEPNLATILLIKFLINLDVKWPPLSYILIQHFINLPDLIQLKILGPVMSIWRNPSPAKSLLYGIATKKLPNYPQYYLLYLYLNKCMYCTFLDECLIRFSGRDLDNQDGQVSAGGEGRSHQVHLHHVGRAKGLRKLRFLFLVRKKY